jgi:polar amino acid transport system substrate-binding protein
MDSEGRVTGEAPETLRRLAARLGWPEPAWVRLDFDEVIPSLLGGRIDVMASAHMITPERASQVRFTRPTVCPPSVLLAQTGHGGIPREELTLEGIAADSTLRPLVLAGSVEEAALAHLGVPTARVEVVYDLRSAAVALRSGRAQVFAITLPSARWMLSSGLVPGFDTLPYDPPARVAHLLGGCSALAVHPDNEALARSLDRALGEFVETPEHDALLASLGFHSGRGGPIHE